MKINSANINYSLILAASATTKDQLQIIKTTKRTISHHSPYMTDICLPDKQVGFITDPFHTKTLT